MDDKTEHLEPDDRTPSSKRPHARSSTGAPVGGSRTTEEQLTADNEAEEDTLRAIDGDSPSA